MWIQLAIKMSLQQTTRSCIKNCKKKLILLLNLIWRRWLMVVNVLLLEFHRQKCWYSLYYCLLACLNMKGVCVEPIECHNIWLLCTWFYISLYARLYILPYTWFYISLYARLYISLHLILHLTLHLTLYEAHSSTVSSPICVHKISSYW